MVGLLLLRATCISLRPSLSVRGRRPQFRSLATPGGSILCNKIRRGAFRRYDTSRDETTARGGLGPGRKDPGDFFANPADDDVIVNSPDVA